MSDYYCSLRLNIPRPNGRNSKTEPHSASFRFPNESRVFCWHKTDSTASGAPEKLQEFTCGNCDDRTVIEGVCMQICSGS